jgi:DNA-binding MarR family transcriptional regulator
VAGDRRSHIVTLTPTGEARFASLLKAVVAFDEQLRAAFSDRDLATLRRLLGRLRVGATA